MRILYFPHQDQEPITRSMQLSYIPVTAFSQTDLFLVWIFLEFWSHRNLSDQLQLQARSNVDMSKWCQHVHLRPHRFILTEACSCGLELAYFAGKISNNALACKNAVAFAYYWSCRLLVSIIFLQLLKFLIKKEWFWMISCSLFWDISNESYNPVGWLQQIPTLKIANQSRCYIHWL